MPGWQIGAGMASRISNLQRRGSSIVGGEGKQCLRNEPAACCAEKASGARPMAHALCATAAATASHRRLICAAPRAAPHAEHAALRRRRRRRRRRRAPAAASAAGPALLQGRAHQGLHCVGVHGHVVAEDLSASRGYGDVVLDAHAYPRKWPEAGVFRDV
jgi:hypothetical protein